MRQRQRYPQNCVGAQRALVRGAVQRQEPRVDRGLVSRVFAFDFESDDVVHVLDRAQYALAPVALGVAVAQLVRFVFSGRGAGRHDGSAEPAAFKAGFHLNGRGSRASPELRARTGWSPASQTAPVVGAGMVRRRVYEWVSVWRCAAAHGWQRDW